MSEGKSIAFLISFEVVRDDRNAEIINEEVKFDEAGFILRPITNEDVKRLSYWLPEKIIHGSYPVPRVGSFILEELENAKHPLPLTSYYFVLALRLMKKDLVYISHIIRKSMLFHLPLPRHKTENYVLYFHDIDELKILLKRLLNVYLIYDSRLITALNTFNNTYYRFFQFPDHDILIDLMICSEALFTDERPLSRTGSIMGLCCSMLIGKNKLERDQIKKHFEDAYKIRNKIVHGKKLKFKEKRLQKLIIPLEPFNEKIKEYLRMSLKKLL